MKSLRQCFNKVSFLLVCGLLTLALSGNLIAQVEAPTPAKPTAKLIRIWTVGSPHNDALPSASVPPVLRSRADSLGFKIENEAVKASGFARRFRQALQEHTEPEILSFDNYFVLTGIRTPLGWFDGIATDPKTAGSLVLVHEELASLQPRGWVMLVRSAVGYEAARSLSLQPPVCDAALVSAAQPRAMQPELVRAQEVATLATRAFLGCDQPTLSGLSDESRLGQQCFLPESDTQVESVRACRVSGNRNLAFVSSVGTFSSQVRVPVMGRGSVHSQALGQQSILTLLRNQGGDWRVLAITADPINTTWRRPLTTPVSIDNALNDGTPGGPAPKPAQLITPDGIYPRPATDEGFGDFTWQPSETSDVIGQVVEFIWGQDTNRGLTRLIFLPARQDRLSTGFLMRSGPSVWRVWTINTNGGIAFSRHHAFMN